MKRKILYFASSYKIGLTRQLTEKACCLNKHYPEGNLLFVSGEREQFTGLFKKLDKENVNYEVIPGLDDHKHFIRLLNNFRKYVEQFLPDIIHVHTNWQLAIAASVKHIYKKKYLIFYTCHGYRHNYRIRSIIARFLIGYALALFANKNIVTSSFLRNRFTFLGKKNELLFLGVDEAFFENPNPLSFTDKRRIIFPGEFRVGKNQDLLIRVIKKYIDKTGDSNLEIYLPGNGDKLEECKSLCKKLGLQNNVYFPGLLAQSELLLYYKMCQYAVVPTNIETFGYCIVEPYILGRVVISRRTGVSEDIIIPGETGFLFDTEKELLQILIDILPNTEKSIYIGNNAFKNRDIFRWDNICEKYLHMVDNLDSPNCLE